MDDAFEINLPTRNSEEEKLALDAARQNIASVRFKLRSCEWELRALSTSHLESLASFVKDDALALYMLSMKPACGTTPRRGSASFE